jgi:hypothetical protein
MKRFMTVVALVFAVFSITAVATGTASNGKATPFKVSYSYRSDPGALFTCSGARVVNSQKTLESETCLISGDTTGWVAGTYSGNPVGNFPPINSQFTWFSDYFFSLDPTGPDPAATSWTAVVTNNHDGTFTVNAVSYY